MSFTLTYSGIRHFSNQAKEWDAVAELTANIRRVRRDIYDALRFGRPASPIIRINGKDFEVAGLNASGNRVAYREPTDE